MSTEPTTLIDGNYLQPVPVNAPRWEYPFRQHGDRTSALFQQDFWQTIATFIPEQLAIPHAKLADFYLVAETQPTRVLSDIVQFTRTYARIPTQQTVPGSLFIAKPDIPGTFPQQIGDYIVFKPVPTTASYNAYQLHAVATDSGTASATYPTGGTYPLTVVGNTATGISYSASAATVQTALNLLTSVINRGGLTVTGTYNSASGFAIAFNAYAAATADGSLLTNVSSHATPSTEIQSLNSGYTQTVTIKNLYFGETWNGGTFTTTMFGQTTGAVAFDASAATIQTALNALSEVAARGGCTVTLPDGQTSAYVIIPYTFTSLGVVFNAFWAAVRFTVHFSNAVITSSSTSLTPSGSIVVPSITDGGVGQTQAVVFSGLPGGRLLTTVDAAHNIVTTDAIYIKADGSYYFLDSGQFSIPTGKSVRLDTGGAAYATAAAITEVGKRSITGYTPTSVLTRVKYVTDFYLVGISAGIASIDDIPLPTYQGDATSLTAAIFSGSTAINYQVGELAYWRDTSLLARTTTTINATQL